MAHHRRGSPKQKQAQRRGIASNKANADRFAVNVRPVIEQIKASGATSLRAIAKALNARGIATARGGVWTPVQVDLTWVSWTKLCERMSLERS
jgi:hypothetical protein